MQSEWLLYCSKQSIYSLLLLLSSRYCSSASEVQPARSGEGCGVGVKQGHGVSSSPPGVATADCRERATVLRVCVMTDTSHHPTFMYC
jgi:hypothetical protein